MMRWLTASLLACATGLAPAAQAETLDEAIAHAVATNPALAAQRARFDATRQQAPQAWAAMLPSVTLTGSGDRSQRDAAPLSEDWNASLNASQSLFNGGRNWAGTRAARAAIAGAAAAYVDFAQRLMLDVATTYAGVREAEAGLAARDASIRNLMEQVRFAEVRIELGLVTPSEVAQSRGRLAQARTQYVQAQGALSAAVEAYIRLVGHPPSALSAPAPAADLPASLDEALDRAGRDSPTLNAARAAAAGADADVMAANSTFLPSITLSASQGVGADPGDHSGEAGFDSVGVRVTWPIFTGGLNLSRNIEQRALRRATSLDLVNATRLVREAVTASWTGLASARAAVVSAHEQVEAGELAYEGVRLQHEAGVGDTLALLIQEQDLLEARLALAAAEAELVVAERRLLAAVGMLAPAR